MSHFFLHKIMFTQMQTMFETEQKTCLSTHKITCSMCVKGELSESYYHLINYLFLKKLLLFFECACYWLCRLIFKNCFLRSNFKLPLVSVVFLEPTKYCLIFNVLMKVFVRFLVLLLCEFAIFKADSTK